MHFLFAERLALAEQQPDMFLAEQLAMALEVQAVLACDIEAALAWLQQQLPWPA